VRVKTSLGKTGGGGVPYQIENRPISLRWGEKKGESWRRKEGSVIRGKERPYGQDYMQGPWAK